MLVEVLGSARGGLDPAGGCTVVSLAQNLSYTAAMALMKSGLDSSSGRHGAFMGGFWGRPCWEYGEYGAALTWSTAMAL